MVSHTKHLFVEISVVATHLSETCADLYTVVASGFVKALPEKKWRK